MARRVASSGVLLDTHIWLWFVFGDEHLPASLRRSVERAEGRRWLSPVSVWELGLLRSRGRVSLDRDLRTWVLDAREAVPCLDAPLTQDVALRSHEVALAHRDPADRFLAATSISYGLTLVTVDDRLASDERLDTLSG